MDKNEILAKSRRENQYKDPVEQAAFQKANDAALTVGIIVCVLLTTLHRQMLGVADFGVWTVDWAIMATVYREAAQKVGSGSGSAGSGAVLGLPMVLPAQ